MKYSIDPERIDEQVEVYTAYAAKVIESARMRAAGMTYREIANDLGIGMDAARRMVSEFERIWRMAEGWQGRKKESAEP